MQVNIHVYSWFSLFVIIIFYEVTANAELASIKPLFLQASDHNFFVNRYIILFFVCFLFNTYYWFIHIELMATSATTHAYTKLL